MLACWGRELGNIMQNIQQLKARAVIRAKESLGDAGYPAMGRLDIT